MGYKCHICDSDLLNLLPNLRRDDYFAFPISLADRPPVPSTNGILTANGDLASAGQDYTTGWGAVSLASVPTGTCVNIVGEGFFYSGLPAAVIVADVVGLENVDEDGRTLVWLETAQFNLYLMRTAFAGKTITFSDGSTNTIHAIIRPEAGTNMYLASLEAAGYKTLAATIGNPTVLTIASDTRRQQVVEAIVPGTDKRFVVGGFSEIIKVAYEELYRSVGMVKGSDGLYTYRAAQVPDGWHEADTALLYIALHSVLLATMNWRDAVYDYWLNHAAERARQLRDNVVWQFDEGNDGIVDLVTTMGQTRLVR
jgi:hypothetical protein